MMNNNCCEARNAEFVFGQKVRLNQTTEMANLTKCQIPIGTSEKMLTFIAVLFVKYCTFKESLKDIRFDALNPIENNPITFDNFKEIMKNAE